MAEQKPLSISSILQNIQTGLAVIAGATVLFTASGFVIVNTALARYTDIFSYRLDAAQYIGAAFSFLLAVIVPFILPSLILWFIDKSIKSLVYKLLFSMLMLAITILILFDWFFGQYFLFRSLPFSDVVTYSAQLSFIVGIPFASMGLIVRLKLPIQLRLDVFVYLSALFFLIIPAYIYGSLFYLFVPRSIGGGQPSSVYLIWDGEVQELQLILRETVPLADEMISACVLAESSDGLLVYRPDTQDTIAIRNKNIVLAMYDTPQLQLDCSPPNLSQSVSEATPEPIAPSETPPP